MTTTNIPTIDQFAVSIGLNEEQTKAVKEYFINLLVTNFELMKQEYNDEIDRAIENLASKNG